MLVAARVFYLYEIKKLIPKIKISGFDISRHGIKNSKKEIKKYLYYHDARKKNFLLKVNILIWCFLLTHFIILDYPL